MNAFLTFLLVVGGIALVVSTIARFFNRHAEGIEKHGTAIFRHLRADILATGRHFARPFRDRRAANEGGPSDEDIRKLMEGETPQLPVREDPPPPPPSQASGGKTVPCVICGTLIPNGGLYCERCAKL